MLDRGEIARFKWIFLIWFFSFFFYNSFTNLFCWLLDGIKCNRALSSSFLLVDKKMNDRNCEFMKLLIFRFRMNFMNIRRLTFNGRLKLWFIINFMNRFGGYYWFISQRSRCWTNRTFAFVWRGGGRIFIFSFRLPYCLAFADVSDTERNWPLLIVLLQFLLILFDFSSFSLSFLIQNFALWMLWFQPMRQQFVFFCIFARPVLRSTSTLLLSKSLSSSFSVNGQGHFELLNDQIHFYYGLKYVKKMLID